MKFGRRLIYIKNFRKYLYTSIETSVIFILTAVWYMEGSFYLGPIPIGIVAGIVLLTQIAVLIPCISNILSLGFQWRIILTMFISGLSILGTGFFFIVWLMFFIA